MATATFQAWGKLRRADDGSVRIHPLCDHMTDVAACLDAVARCAAVRQALDTAAGRPLTEVDLARLAVLAFLHDIGKANAGFQGRCWLASDPRSRHWPHACGHSTEGWLLFADGGCAIPNGADILRDLPIDALASWGEAAVTALLRASISHHGRPVDEGRQALHVWQPVLDPVSGRYDPASAVSEMARRVVSSYPLAFTDGYPELPDRPALAHLFGGLVQLADWLGSDTRPGFFSYAEPGEDRTTTAATRARHAVTVLGLDAGAWRASVAQGPPSFSKAFQVEQPRPMQTAAAAHDLGPVVILEAETGSGKTEAALWRFLHLFQQGQVDSLYFALPTRVAASQLYERVRDFVVRVWPEDAPVVVRALPGYEAADGEQKISLPDYQVLWPDQPDDNRAAQRWAAESPKRFLAATIAVGTVDQALLGALRVRHAHLRQALLTRSLLVVDEVHASDAYMTVLLERLLQAHVACGGQALLLSATLGAAARTRYLNVGHASRQLPVVPLKNAMAQPYPALGTRTSPSAIRLDAVAGNPRHKHLCWQTLDAIEDAERIARLAVDAAKRGARVLVVRNTVPSAVATLRAVEVLCAAQGGDWLFKVNGASTLHHSRFSRQDRPQLDQAVQTQLGKHRADHRGRIVIGTQTLEQSLDIDADLLITDLCPMDVLLQRIGRLHRHERPSTQHPDDHRPAGFESPTAWVLTPAHHDLAPLLKRSRHGLGPMRTGAGLDGVYVDLRILEATRRLIDAQPTRLIPQDNRALVELATHQEALTAIERELGADWQRFGQELDGSLSAKSSLARLHALPYDQPYDERLTFPDSEQKIATRLGAADRLVVTDPPLIGPFGQPVRQLTLRHHQVPAGLSPDALPTDVTPLPEHAGFEFTLGDRRYRYDRFGLERLKASTA
jgi:CRISPR-associated endonuclease/helicase Cas3